MEKRGGGLKQQLSSLLRPSTLLRTRCNSTASSSIFSSSSIANTSSRHSLSTAATTTAAAANGNNNINLDRSLSFSSSSRILYRPTKPSEATDVVSKVNNEKIRKEGRARGSVDFYLFDYYGSDKVDAKNLKKKKKHKFLLSNNAYGFSHSSDDNLSNSVSSNDESENSWSKSFSPDSFEFYKRPSSSSSSRKKKKKKNNNEKQNLPSSCSGIPVMKMSTDPYVDFCDSMVDMILERQLFGTKDLQALLLCYLSLNSPHHHSIILRAFADVSQVLFGH